MTNRKVMIIDDDKDFLAELKETLSLSGYEVIAIDNSMSVLDMAAKSNLDVVLIDLKMPAKSGFQLADELRHLSEFNNVPIIAMTGYFKEGYTPLMRICGIKRYLKKPFSALNVISEIEEALKEVRGSKA